MASELTNLSPMTVGGKVLPTPHLFENIPMLHLILEEVLKDWLRSVEPYQRRVDNADTNSHMAMMSAVAPGFMELQPLLLKSLFSYAFFFVSADDAYAYFYRELNLANRLSGLNLKHGKPPKKSPFVRKIGIIRDIAIAHFPSTKAAPIDAYAAMSWKPMSLSWDREGHPDLERLTFGWGLFQGKDTTGRSVQSQDLEVPGIKTAHYVHCLPYLEDYDKVCCEYLSSLQDEIS